VPTLTYVFLALLLLIAAYAVFGRRRHARLKAACQAEFTRLYASTTPAPSFEMSYSYGEPVFQVRFASQDAMAAAAQANAAFLRAMDVLCRERGRKRPFKAERAVFFEYPPVDAPPVVHCCATMQAQAGPTGSADAAIAYAARTNAYGLRGPGRGAAVLAIAFCPWCGTALPAPAADQTKSRTR